MNRSKLGYLILGVVLLLALATPLNVGSASAFSGYQTTVPTVSRSATAVVPVERYVDHYYYHRTYEDLPHGYVVHRDFYNYDPYYRPHVYHREYYTAPGIKIGVPFFSFRFGF